MSMSFQDRWATTFSCSRRRSVFAGCRPPTSTHSTTSMWLSLKSCSNTSPHKTPKESSAQSTRNSSSHRSLTFRTTFSTDRGASKPTNSKVDFKTKNANEKKSTMMMIQRRNLKDLLLKRRPSKNNLKARSVTHPCSETEASRPKTSELSWLSCLLECQDLANLQSRSS